jgi:hypothetical protein
MAELIGKATVYDWDTSREVEVTIEAEHGMLFLSPKGYSSPMRDSPVAILCVKNNRLVLEVYTSLLTEEPLSVQLEPLRKENWVARNKVEESHDQAVQGYEDSEKGIWDEIHKASCLLSNLIYRGRFRETCLSLGDRTKLCQIQDQLSEIRNRYSCREQA